MFRPLRVHACLFECVLSVRAGVTVPVVFVMLSQVNCGTCVTRFRQCGVYVTGMCLCVVQLWDLCL